MRTSVGRDDTAIISTVNAQRLMPSMTPATTTVARVICGKYIFIAASGTFGFLIKAAHIGGDVDHIACHWRQFQRPKRLRQ